MATGKPTGRPRVLFGSPQAPAARSDAPRVVVAGQVRKRIPATRESLMAFDAQASTAIADAALPMINAVNLDDHHFEDTVNFAAGLQEAYAALTEAELAIVESDDLATARNLALELVGLFRRLDPNRVFRSNPGILDGLKDFVNGGSAQQQFDALAPLIAETAAALQQHAGTIAARLQALKRLKTRNQGLELKITAAILAGRFIIHSVASAAPADAALGAHHQAQANAIDVRVASLTSTLTSMALSRQTLQASMASAESLAQSCAALVREDVAMWRAAYVAALIAARHGAAAAEKAALSAMHGRITRKLVLKG